MSSRRNFNPVRSLRYAAWRFRGRMALHTAGIVLGDGLNAVGQPIVSVYPNSTIRLGQNVTLISRSFATALGVNHPVVLRTLATGAIIKIGNRVGISGGSICSARLVEIGDDTLLGANVTISDTDFHSLYPAFRAGHTHPTIGVAEVRVGSRVLIGTNAIVLKGVSIGDNSVIGAGSVVTKSIPANCIAAGNPCRVIRELMHEELSEVIRPNSHNDTIR
jgi:acetyltransferase-like isoleucine patch superfamily enzyme